MKTRTIILLFSFLCVINGIAQNKGTIIMKNADTKVGLLENKGKHVLFYENKDAEPTKISHEEIEHIKTGDIEYFRESPNSKKLLEFQVLVYGEVKLLARNFQTNYRNMEIEYEERWIQTPGNRLTSSSTRRDIRKVVRGPRNKGTIIKYYIKKENSPSIEQVYRLVVGDVDWLGYKKKIKRVLGDCKNLIQKMNAGDFKDNEYGKDEELAAIVRYYNESCIIKN